MANLFFDFDGTIVDSKVRLYKLFCELCIDNKFSFNDYWELKRESLTQAEILKKYFNYEDVKVKEFHKSWLKKVEEPQRLLSDKLVLGMDKVLASLTQRHKLYVVTNRQNRELLIKQTEDLQLKKYFQTILVTEQRKLKSDMIDPFLSLSNNDFLIGDTGEDIKEAKFLGIKSIAVAWGSLSVKVLMKYQPDFIVEKVEQIDKCISL